MLVVEDSPTQALQLAELLTARGYGVTVANDGAEALQRLADSRPALVLSDIAMPGMDGYEVPEDQGGPPSRPTCRCCW